ncbi:MFS transporter [candidate division WWE3 bacterium]|uniref:MFS transporter n=1 Tax=candidate division WWE3 bacterium TaxID=2053526 RepID=A0A955LFX7_UNCKA|nr:MFS transporter [candidate division WWE3 bacterium]
MGNRNIRILYAVRLLGSLHFIGGVLIPFFTEWGHISEPMIPVIQLWFMWWAAFLEVPTGAVADYISRKASVLLGFLISGLGFWIYVIGPHLAWFLIGEWLIALGVALVSGADESILYDTLLEEGRPEEATRISSRYGIVSMFGILVGSPLGSWVGVHWGLAVPHVLTGMALVMSAVVALLLHEPSISSQTIDPAKRYRDVLSRGVKIFWSNKKVRLLGLNLALVHAISGTIIWLNQIALEDLSISPIWFGYVVSAGVMSEIILAHVIGDLEDRFGFRLIAVVTQIMPAVGFFLIVFGIFRGNIPIVLVGTMLPYSILIGRRSMLKAHINHHIPSSERATVLSTVELVRKGITGGAYIIMSLTLGVGVWLPMTIFGCMLVMGLTIKTLNGQGEP